MLAAHIEDFDKNPRRIMERGLADLILQLFDLAEPVVVKRDDTIVGGDARVQALKRIHRGKAQRSRFTYR
jgi:hypothetical protein